MHASELPDVFSFDVACSLLCTNGERACAEKPALLTSIFTRAAEHVIEHAHPGLFGSLVCKHSADMTVVVSGSRATEAVVIVPQKLEMHAIESLRAVEKAACENYGGILGRPCGSDAASAAESRVAWHFREALEHVHVVFVSSLREAVACIAGLHAGSRLQTEIARSAALLQAAARAAAKSIAQRDSIISGGASDGLTERSSAAAGVVSAASSDRSGDESASADGRPPAGEADAHHVWLKLDVLGNSASARGVFAEIEQTSAAGFRSFSSGAGSAARGPSAGPGAAGSAGAAAPSGAGRSLSAAPTFIAIHAFDELMLEHYEEVRRKRRADGSLADRASTYAAAGAPDISSATAAAASTAFPTSSTIVHEVAATHGLGHPSQPAAAAFANPLVLSAASRLLAVSSAALQQSDRIWRQIEVAATSAMAPLRAIADGAAEDDPRRSSRLHMCMPRANCQLVLSMAHESTLGITLADADTERGASCLRGPPSGLSQLLARLNANITIIRGDSL